MEHMIVRSTASHDTRARPPSRVGGVVMGGDYQGLGIARSLGRLGVPVIVIDDERSIAGASRYVRRTVRVPDLRSEEATRGRAPFPRGASRGWRGGSCSPRGMSRSRRWPKRLVQLEAWFRVPSPGWAIDPACVGQTRARTELASSLGIPIPHELVPRLRRGTSRA